jgi:hypothetical protein
MAMILLFMVTVGSYAQLSIKPLAVSKTWQHQMDKAIPDMKDELTLKFNEGLWDFSNFLPKTGLTKEEWPTLISLPVANFRLDFTAFMSLQPESKIEELVRLDTTCVTYLSFKKNENTTIIMVSGTLRNGVWKRASMSSLGGIFSNTVKQLYRKKVPVYELRIERGPSSSERTLLFFKENGRFLAFHRAPGKIRPLMDVLMGYQDNVKRQIVF